MSTSQTSPSISDAEIENIDVKQALADSGLSNTIVQEEVEMAKVTIKEQEQRMREEVRVQSK